MKNPKIGMLADAILVVVSLAVGFILSEAGYRFLLYRDVPERFHEPPVEQLGVYDKSHWIYDEKFGYGYPPGRVINYTNIQNGKVNGCSTINVINELGTIGPIVGNYKDAAVKIMVIGDSFAVFNLNYKTWPLLLQTKLQERLGKPVHVLNFGRDGYGILQMFDLAAAKAAEWKPDLVIIAFITNDLARIRTWRADTIVNGRQRLLTTFQPSPNPDIETTYETFVVNSKATREWCEAIKNTDRRDTVLEEIEDAYQNARKPGGRRKADIWTLKHSYLFARVRRGDPFIGVTSTYSFPSLQIASYADDKRFMESFRALQATGVPYIIFHNAFYPEIKEGKEYITNFHEERLLKSLEETTGKTIYKTTDYIKMPVERPERMNASETNFHPSEWGMELYSDAVTEVLTRNKLVQ